MSTTVTCICNKCSSILKISTNNITNENHNCLICFNLLQQEEKQQPIKNNDTNKDDTTTCNSSIPEKEVTLSSEEPVTAATASTNSTNIPEKVLTALEPYEISNKNEIEYNITLPSEMLFIIYSAQCYLKEEALVDKECTRTTDLSIKDIKENILSTIRSQVSDKYGNTSTTNEEDVKEIEEGEDSIGKIEVRIIIGCEKELSNPPKPFVIDTDNNANNKHNRKNNRYQKSKALYSRTSIYKVLSSQQQITETSTAIKALLSSWYKSFQEENKIPNYSIQVTAKRKSIFMIGHYNKLLRNISQTPFFKEDVAPTSVSENISNPIFPLFYVDTNDKNKDGIKFHGSGREDLDVRMLNKGRKFGLEICDAIRIPTQTEISTRLLRVEDKMNIAGVNIVDNMLNYADSYSFSHLQSETEEKTKEYMCLCWCEVAHTKEKLEEVLMHNLTFPLLIHQQTPLRVLHRRANLSREKLIHTMKVVQWINVHWFLLVLKTSSGAYVKEFVHGDLGRTSPCVSGLLEGRVDIMQLDVLEVEEGKNDP